MTASPSALGRNGSKSGVVASGGRGNVTPLTGSSAIGVKASTGILPPPAQGGKRASTTVPAGTGGGNSTHPYASASQVQIGGFDRTTDSDYGGTTGGGVYRSSAQQATGPGGMSGNNGGNNGYEGVEGEQEKFSWWKVLLCRCS